MSKKIAIIGAGGHGKVVGEIALLNEYSIINFFDDRANEIQDYPFAIFGNLDDLKNHLDEYDDFFVAIGDNKWQDSHKNVVERCNLYIADAMKMGIDLKNVLLIFDGPAFVPNEDGNYRGSSGKQIVRSRHYNTALINPTSEEIRIEFQNILDRIIEKENQ